MVRFGKQRSRQDRLRYGRVLLGGAWHAQARLGVVRAERPVWYAKAWCGGLPCGQLRLRQASFCSQW